VAARLKSTFIFFQNIHFKKIQVVLFFRILSIGKVVISLWNS
jgi:hypothetical protein